MQLRISRRLQGSCQDDAKSVSRQWNDTKSVPRCLDWEIATLAGNKDGCQIHDKLVDDFKERDKMTYLDIKIKCNPEIGPIPLSKQPYTNLIPV